MTLAVAARDWLTANEIFQTTFLCQALASVLLFAATVAFVAREPVAAFFNFHLTTNTQADTMLVILIGYMLLGINLSMFRAAYRASELEARGAMLLNTWRATDLAIVITTLSFHGTPIRLAECMLAGVFLWVVLGFLDVRRRCPKVQFGLSRISWFRIREVIVHGSPLLVGQATIALFMQGYPLVVNRTLGASAVVSLTTLRAVSRLGLLPVQTVAFSSSPQLSRSYGGNDTQLFIRLLAIMGLVSAITTLCVTTGLGLFGPWIIAKWTGGRLTTDHLTVTLFALSVAFQGVWTCCMIALSSCNRHHVFNYGYLVITLLSLGVTLAITRNLGFHAVPAIMLASDVCIALLGWSQCRQKLPHFRFNNIFLFLHPSFYRGLRASFQRQNPTGVQVGESGK